MLITCAPLRDRPADRLGLAPRRRSGPSSSTTFATSSSADGAIPAMPVALSTPAAIIPATKVPWPSVSTRAEPPTKLAASAICPRTPDGRRRSRSRSPPRGRAGGAAARPRSRTRGSVAQVPLLRDERVVRHERGPPGVEPLDVGRAGKVAQARRARRARRRARGAARGSPSPGPSARRSSGRSATDAGAHRVARRLRELRRGERRPRPQRAPVGSWNADRSAQPLRETRRRRDARAVAAGLELERDPKGARRIELRTSRAAPTCLRRGAAARPSRRATAAARSR